MAKVLLLLPAGTYRATDFIDAARTIDQSDPGASEQATEVVVVSDAFAVGGSNGIEVDFSRPKDAAKLIVESVAAASVSEPPHDVAAVVAVDDVGVLTASYTRVLLGLPGNSPETVELTRNKLAMHERLMLSDVSQPAFAAIPAGAGNESMLDAAKSVGFPAAPCVVKPVGLSGSRGVIRVDNPSDLAEAVRHARLVAADAGEPDAALIIEQYIAGAEVAVEAIVDGGVLTTLAVFDKPGASTGPYFEETYYVTPSQQPADTLADLDRSVAAAAHALGIVEGPVHAEARIDNSGEVWILEVAARSIGGLCSRSLRFGLGVSLETLLLRQALSLPVSDLTRESAASGVLMLPIPAEGVLEAVDGQDEARSVFGIQGLEITIPLGHRVRPLPDGDRYLGFMFARGQSPEAVESTLRDAHAKLGVVITPLDGGADSSTP